MRYVFHPQALTEYTEAVQYYLQQRVEVAQAFINAIEDAVYRIRESPTRYIVIYEDVRRCMTRKFPYGILYTIEQDYILILAVMHCSREPGYWKNRR
ncbi:MULTISPECIES: type II toxin-antitoxin system RelE/ParE family toxin [unclassified Tolypothrix]|uniref:type II toxin-antitoxin system RelE/ParE family toxin n=1 Tax=unclassified Tolypothrix TaxID=2649714 RepID=UPI0005EAA567|nr:MULTISPECIES: type II toxin-antitoxin system RelE/ParE family toxin [unclassified Tolypothrix]BAY94137.1 plasmid stabilization system [Microchaete diplosiphon NIES-3275]EKF03804.1 toxin-antitoxin system, toxin component, RelE family [Tolypothrix sp. PCC 7601]MBE9086862.1 type II toxin-antitoxin system RelE/ParE family toxin [Tolypothrix sp. LEGE 11397]UYD27890.1 type II toxin-antitoxin system RelE/ParE family toxin [Tolypothrix sp. PCC 7712]UYD36243.1 type II toxin-antitoxin system RelE/Par